MKRHLRALVLDGDDQAIIPAEPVPAPPPVLIPMETVGEMVELPMLVWGEPIEPAKLPHYDLLFDRFFKPRKK